MICNAEDIGCLFRTRRVLAAALNARDRGLPQPAIGRHIAQAFPELCSQEALERGSVLPLAGFDALGEATKEALLNAALDRLIFDGGPFQRDAGGDDVERLAALPRVVATLIAMHEHENISEREFFARAFPSVYPDGCFVEVFPVAGLDDLGMTAIPELLELVSQDAEIWKSVLVKEMKVCFPDIFQGWSG